MARVGADARRAFRIMTGHSRGGHRPGRSAPPSTAFFGRRRLWLGDGSGSGHGDQPGAARGRRRAGPVGRVRFGSGRLHRVTLAGHSESPMGRSSQEHAADSPRALPSNRGGYCRRHPHHPQVGRPAAARVATTGSAWWPSSPKTTVAPPRGHTHRAGYRSTPIGAGRRRMAARSGPRRRAA